MLETERFKQSKSTIGQRAALDAQIRRQSSQGPPLASGNSPMAKYLTVSLARSNATQVLATFRAGANSRHAIRVRCALNGTLRRTQATTIQHSKADDRNHRINSKTIVGPSLPDLQNTSPPRESQSQGHWAMVRSDLVVKTTNIMVLEFWLGVARLGVSSIKTLLVVIVGDRHSGVDCYPRKM